MLLTKFVLSPVKDISLNYSKSKSKYQSEFDDITFRLNCSKSKLDEIPETKFYTLTKSFDKYRPLKIQLQTKFNMQIVTNAVLKMYELISQLNLIPESASEFNVFCNAELPGGFIVAINHYIKTMRNCKLNWVASSYVSDTGTLGDSYGFYEHNKEKWLMSDIMNGDVTDKRNILEIERLVHERFEDGVDLYTSDIGIDVSSDYNNQESLTLPLNYYQIVCGLLTLRLSGSLIVKQFTFFTPFNRSLLYLLTTLFDKVYITKPATSKPLNSEIYVVCFGFKGLTEGMRSYLLSLKDIKPDKTLIDLSDINESNLLKCTSIYNNQIKLLDDLYESYRCNKIINKNSNVREWEMWIDYNKVKSIDKEDCIPSNYTKK